MKKTSFAFVLVFLICDNSFAQHSISFGPQVGFASSFRSTAKMGIGASVEYETMVTDVLGIRGSLGHSYFKSKLIYDDSRNVSLIPLRAGVQVHIIPALFVLGDGGVAFFADNNKVNKTGLSYGVGAGFRIPLNATQFLQFSGSYNYLKYDHSFNYTWFNVGVLVGLSFGNKKG